jgi:hypothetical protein
MGKHMSVTSGTGSRLQDAKIDAKIKLAALGAATRFGVSMTSTVARHPKMRYL